MKFSVVTFTMSISIDTFDKSILSKSDKELLDKLSDFDYGAITDIVKIIERIKIGYNFKVGFSFEHQFQ